MSSPTLRAPTASVETSGRLIAVETDENIIPVLVTPEFQSMNIQKEQKLVFILEVDEKGILRTRKVTKS